LLAPFPYFYFIPTKIYLGTSNMALVGYAIAGISWVIMSSYLVRLVWKRGLRDYSFYGR